MGTEYKAKSKRVHVITVVSKMSVNVKNVVFTDVQAARRYYEENVKTLNGNYYLKFIEEDVEILYEEETK